MLNFEVLIAELGAINRLPATPITLSEVSTLEHEPWDDTVELGPFVPQRLSLFPLPLLSRAESAEILCCLRDHICEEFHPYPACSLSPNRDVEIHVRVVLRVACANDFGVRYEICLGHRLRAGAHAGGSSVHEVYDSN